MKEVYLYKKAEKKFTDCLNCAHYCKIAPGKRGICGVRENIGGKLFALNYGKAVSVQIDPVEKKPLFNFFPGTETLSIATVGCNFSCLNCQNYDISQMYKTREEIPGQDLPPEEIVKLAKDYNLPSISYTYVEPAIFSEYALDTMKLAKKAGIKNIWVTNGFLSKEVFEMVSPFLDAANVDIKSFSEDFYRKNCGGRLQPVLDTLKRMKDAGVWIETTTLIIPTLNDSLENLEKIANFISAGLGKEVPWHITRFCGLISWKLKELPETPKETLKKAYDIGKKSGLEYVYTGNIPGLPYENTPCPDCGALCIEREGCIVDRYDKTGKCPECGKKLEIIDKQ